MAFNNSTNPGSHTASHGNPIQNTAAAINPNTGHGSHLPPTDQSRNPLSAGNDHYQTSTSNNPLHHNETTGTGHSGLAGGNHSTTHHNKREDGGVVDALNPSKGGGAHLPNSGAQHTSTSQGHNLHDETRSHGQAPLGSTVGHSSTHPTGNHASSGLTGGSHASHGRKPEDGGVVDALNPSKGPSGSHLPTSSQHGSSHPTNVHGAGGNSNLVGQGREPAGNVFGGAHNVATGTSTSHAGEHAHVQPGAHNTTGSALGGHKDQHTTHGATGTHPNEKVSLADKTKGSIATIVGKVTKNEDKILEGQALKQGDHVAAQAHHAGGAAHTSTH